MATDLNLRPPFRWIENLLTAARAARRLGGFFERSYLVKGGVAFAVLVAAGAVHLIGSSPFETRVRSEVVAISAGNEKLHLSDDLSTAAFAPAQLRAGFDWREGAMGVVLTWEPTPHDLRIYRIPAGRSKYVQADGLSGQLFDADVVPGRVHSYVACAYFRGHEYCPDPIGFEIPEEILR
ncbi:hypothetical protein [Methylosinus sp. Sm6]|uniref:hypothetical protein n=1 Tax=Methylosinus sp. Sm6 TaxID=2866948 RepID=UPI001C995AF2|nr:hypothetical protein [Methylosinus sp. Sm6]MBY6242461.1 hypothetical protein [Methylosinus sp. Sm6]